MLYYRSIAIASAFVIPFAATASTAVIKDEAERLQYILEHQAEMMTKEDRDLTLEAGTELFPDDGTVLEPEREGNVSEESGFVTFRLGDVPYVFTDVPTSQWFAPYVRDVAEKGIVSGYKNASGVPLGLFGPDRNVTLEELAKMAVQSAALTLASCPAEPLNPLAKGAWSAPYVSCAEKNGFAIYVDGTADLKRQATRSEVVVTVLQAFGRAIGEDVVTSFKDVSSSTLFAPAIAVAVRDGIVSGYTDAGGTPTGFFGPGNPVNRAEVAKIISRSLQLYSQ